MPKKLKGKWPMASHENASLGITSNYAAGFIEHQYMVRLKNNYCFFLTFIASRFY